MQQQQLSHRFRFLFGTVLTEGWVQQYFSTGCLHFGV
jgi:hypothetical protein